MTRLFGAVLGCLSLTMCASVDPVAQDDKAPLRRDSAQNGPLKSKPLADELAELGVLAQTRRQGPEEWSRVLSVEQIGSAGKAGDYAFDPVEGVHQCQRGGARPADCKAALDAQNEAGSGADVSALSEIQALTPDVVNPETFDPAVTADEIGRARAPQSQAAQAVGSQFLDTAPAPAPSPDLDVTRPQDRADQLPPLASDFISRQTPGSGN